MNLEMKKIVIGGLFLVLATIVGAIITKYSLSSLPFFEPERHTFSEESISVLILPMEPIFSYSATKIEISKAIYNRMSQVIDEEPLIDFEVYYDTTSRLPSNHSESREIGLAHNADVVVWGELWEQTPADTLLLVAKYTLTDPNALVYRTYGEYRFKTARPTNIFRGNLLGDINYIVHFLIAQYYYNMGDLEKSIEALNKSIEIAGDEVEYLSLDAHFQLAEILREQSDLLKAIDEYELVIEMDSSNTRARVNLGVSLDILGHHELAKDQYRKGIEVIPHTAQDYCTRGAAHLNLGNHSEALKDFDNAIRVDRKFAKGYGNRALAHTYLGEYSKAVRDIKKAIYLSPNDANWHARLAQIHTFERKFKKAIEAYNKSLQINPYSYAALEGRAQVYRNLRDYDSALNDLDKAIALNPNSHMSYLMRSQVYAKMDSTSEALSDCNRAVELSPNLGIVYGFRGSVLLAIGKPEEALADLDKALAIGVDAVAEEISILIERTAVLFELKRYREVISDCDDVLDRDSRNPLAYYNKAAAYGMLDEQDSAFFFLRKSTNYGMRDYVGKDAIESEEAFSKLRNDRTFVRWLNASWK